MVQFLSIIFFSWISLIFFWGGVSKVPVFCVTLYFSLLSKNIKINIYIQQYNFTCCFVWERISSVTLTENHGLKVFENRALRKILGRKRDEVIEKWRRLHNEEIYNLVTPNYF